tara:strand:+ start:1010 stop:1600 length:591 start_codon:yes stop_codon:yes gene_type:complete
MVDIREIMQSGNARLERLLEKIANNSKGIYKAANTFILETIDRLARKEAPTEEQVKTTSKLLTAVILEAFNQFRKRNFKAEISDFEEIDMDSEEASDKLFPDGILQDLTKRAIMMLDDVPEDMREELLVALQSKAGQNFARYAGNLTMFYLVREAPMLAEADKREERTEIRVPDEDEDFSDKFREMNKSWFNGLRK